MITDFYALDENKKPYRVSINELASIYSDHGSRITKQDTINGVLISTVFLAIDHRFTNQGDPILWETMIFGGKHDQYQERYTSHEDALRGHQVAVDMVINDN